MGDPYRYVSDILDRKPKHTSSVPSSDPHVIQTLEKSVRMWREYMCTRMGQYCEYGAILARTSPTWRHGVPRELLSYT